MDKKFYDLEKKFNKAQNERGYDYDCYHTTPEDEAIVTILSNFSKFRFEVAIAALWKRHFSVLLSFGLLLFFSTPFILLNKIFRIKSEQTVTSQNLTKRFMQEYFAKGKFIKSFFLGFGMIVFGLAKFVYNIIYMAGWIIIMLARYIVIHLIRALSGFAIALAISKKSKKLF